MRAGWEKVMLCDLRTGGSDAWISTAPRSGAPATRGSPRSSVAGGSLISAPALTAGAVAAGTRTGSRSEPSDNGPSAAFGPPSVPKGTSEVGVFGEKLTSVLLGNAGLIMLPLTMQF